MRGSLRPGGQLRTDPAHVRFGPVKRGSCRYALPVSLLSSSAAEVRVGELRGGARLHLELVEGGTFKVVLEATRAAIVEATLLFTTSSGGSLAIPVSARILEPTLFHARANSLHVEREPPPSGPIEMMPLVASSRAVQILRLPGRRAGGPRLGWVETTIEPPAAELVVTGGGGGDAAAAAAVAEAETEAEEDRAIGATQLALGRDEVQGLQHRLIEVYEKVRRVSAQVAKVAPQMRMVAAIGKFGKLPGVAGKAAEALQAELRQLTPTIEAAVADLKLFRGGGLHLQGAIQQAALAPARVEGAASRERLAHAALAEERLARQSAEAAVAAAEAASRRPASAAAATGGGAAAAAEARELRTRCSRMALAEAEVRAALLASQKEVTRLRVIERRVAEEEKAEAATADEIGALRRKLDDAQRTIERLESTLVPKAEVEKAQQQAAYLERQLERAEASAMEKKEAAEALTRSAKIEVEWRYNVQRVLEKLLKWTERADVAPKLPAGLYAAGGDAFSKRREAEDWLGTLASLLGAVRTRAAAGGARKGRALGAAAVAERAPPLAAPRARPAARVERPAHRRARAIGRLAANRPPPKRAWDCDGGPGARSAVAARPRRKSSVTKR